MRRNPYVRSELLLTLKCRRVVRDDGGVRGAVEQLHTLIDCVHVGDQHAVAAGPILSRECEARGTLGVSGMVIHGELRGAQPYLVSVPQSLIDLDRLKHCSTTVRIAVIC